MSWFSELDDLAAKRGKVRKRVTVDDVLEAIQRHKVSEVRQAHVYQLHMMVQDDDLVPALGRAKVKIVKADDNFV